MILFDLIIVVVDTDVCFDGWSDVDNLDGAIEATLVKAEFNIDDDTLTLVSLILVSMDPKTKAYMPPLWYIVWYEVFLAFWSFNSQFRLKLGDKLLAHTCHLLQSTRRGTRRERVHQELHSSKFSRFLTTWAVSREKPAKRCLRDELCTHGISAGSGATFWDETQNLLLGTRRIVRKCAIAKKLNHAFSLESTQSSLNLSVSEKTCPGEDSLYLWIAGEEGEKVTTCERGAFLVEKSFIGLENKWRGSRERIKMRISADIYSIQTALFSECSKAEPRWLLS